MITFDTVVLTSITIYLFLIGAIAYKFFHPKKGQTWLIFEDPPIQRIFTFSGIVMVIPNGLVLYESLFNSKGADIFLPIFLMLTGVLFSWVGSMKTKITEKGVAHFFWFFRWNEIQSYSWKETSHKQLQCIIQVQSPILFYLYKDVILVPYILKDTIAKIFADHSIPVEQSL